MILMQMNRRPQDNFNGRSQQNRQINTSCIRWPRAIAYFQTRSCKIVSHSVVYYCREISVFSLGGWRKGRGGCVRNIGHEHDVCQAQKAGNTDPRTNYAVKYATARGHLTCKGSRYILEIFPHVRRADGR